MDLRIMVLGVILTWLMFGPASQQEYFVRAIQRAHRHSSGAHSRPSASVIGLVCCGVILALLWLTLRPN